MTSTTPEQTTAKPATKRPSRASKAAAAAQRDSKPAAPKANGKPAAVKPVKKDEGPTATDQKRIAYQWIVDVVDSALTPDAARKLGLTYDFLRAECGRNLSYGPGSYTSAKFIQPGTGRGSRHVAK
jgi:hypothetical protein